MMTIVNNNMLCSESCLESRSQNSHHKKKKHIITICGDGYYN